MITTISAIALALIVGTATYFLTRGLDRARSFQLTERRKRAVTVAVQIICGDCGGESERAYRTQLDRDGHCESCGGTSYVLASNLAMSAALARSFRPAYRRVLPFETARRQTKIAV